MASRKHRRASTDPTVNRKARRKWFLRILQGEAGCRLLPPMAVALYLCAHVYVWPDGHCEADAQKLAEWLTSHPDVMEDAHVAMMAAGYDLPQQ